MSLKSDELAILRLAEDVRPNGLHASDFAGREDARAALECREAIVQSPAQSCERSVPAGWHITEVGRLELASNTAPARSVWRAARGMEPSIYPLVKNGEST